MKFSQIVGLLTIALFVGCIISNEDSSRPEFIEDLYQKEQLPDSVGLDTQIEIKKAQNDNSTVEFL